LKVNQIGWKDNALVLLMSTIFTGHEFEYRIRKKPNTAQPRARPMQLEFGDEPVKRVHIPVASTAYNDHMGAVDVGDQLRATLRATHRKRRGPWRAVAWEFLLLNAVVNTYILQKKAPCRWKAYSTQGEWRQRLVDDILIAYGPTGSSRVQGKAGDEISPLSQHKRVGKQPLRNCYACLGHRAGQPRKKRSRRSGGDALAEVSGNAQRRQSRSKCETCDVPLCNSSFCWDLYHSTIC
jgi:hypothetical protein